MCSCTNPSFAQNLQDIQLANEYLLNGDKKKALSIYETLSKTESNLPLIYNNYFTTLLDESSWEEAQLLLKRLSKRDPSNIQYKLDQGLLALRMGDVLKAEKQFRGVMGEYRLNPSQSKAIADYFTNRQLFDYAIEALDGSRKALGNGYLFTMDMAMLYRLRGDRDKMIDEYLNYVTQSSASIQYVKNVLQAFLTKPDELESLERNLYEKTRLYPDSEVYVDLLIWVTLQQKNFYASFVQARAYDKRYKKMGEKCMEVAQVALSNKDFENASIIFSYITKEFPQSPFVLNAKLGLIQAREAKIKNTYPVQPDSVRILINQYQQLITENAESNNSFEALRNQALLYSNYLNEYDIAIQLLQKLTDNPRASIQLKAKAKLDLGDIYLYKNEPWESALLYSQVEKLQKETPVAYEAKLKNAKLSYYRGNFKLAEEHLNILKQATTREIANDAIDLSMRIKENTSFDTLGLALQQYAAIELLLVQNRLPEAKKEIENLKQGVGRDSSDAVYNYVILDDLYWLEASLLIKEAKFEAALTALQRIRDNYPDDVLADDAYFMQGEIYEQHLADKQKAMEVYRDFLTRFPGSVHVAEARKRFRLLRGDFATEVNP